MDRIFEAIEEWMRNLLTGMVSSNLTTMYTDVNGKNRSDYFQVGQTPQGWNGNIYGINTKYFRFGHCTNCRYDYHICTLL